MRKADGGEFMTTVARVSSTVFFFSSRRRHTRFDCDWSSDVCSSDLADAALAEHDAVVALGEDVFGGHQEFVERGGHAALEEDRFFGASSALEQGEIGRASCRERV